MTDISADSFRHILDVKTSEDSQGNKVKETRVIPEETIFEMLQNQHTFHSLDALLRALEDTRKVTRV